MIVGFDADVLIYAAAPRNPYRNAILTLLESQHTLIGSTLLTLEVLIKPTRLGDLKERDTLNLFLARLELQPVSQEIAVLAVSLGATYGLKTVDAAHLATAIYMGAEQFLTNNRKDFKKEQVLELAILYPDDL